MDYFLGVDIGTFESKGVLVDANGTIAASAARPHRMLVPQPGWAEHRAQEDWWGDFTFIVKRLLSETGIDPSDIKSVGTSGIGPCMLPVDADGEPLMHAVLYGVDGRAALEVEELTRRIGEETLIARCGNALTSQSVGPKILWLKRHHPDIHAAAAKIVSCATFLVQKLTGACVMDHFTAASFSPLYNAEEQCWDTRLAPDIIEMERLPKLVWSTEIAGHISAKASLETGLAEGTPVIAGTIDAAAEAFSVGVTDTGDMMVMYGSTIFIILLSDRRITDPRLWHAPWLFPGLHAVMSGLATSGTLTHWFRDQFARELEPANAFAVLAQEAEQSPPGSHGLVFLPHFSGERTPLHDPHAKGVFFGLNLTHRRGDLYRALLEGIACGTRQIFETYTQAGTTPLRVMAVGGGTKNAIWSGATSDATGFTQLIAEKTIGASYGDAFLAALGIGAVDLGDIARWNPIAREIVPQPSPQIARQYDIYRKLYARTRDLMVDLDTSS
jgi:xylulokinase